VFDLGGGTFDVSILQIDSGVFEVVSTSGDTHLGGEDFDQRVMEYFMKLIKKKHGKDISGDKKAVQKLRREAERAKRVLSNQHQVCEISAPHPLICTPASLHLCISASLPRPSGCVPRYILHRVDTFLRPPVRKRGEFGPTSLGVRVRGVCDDARRES
jgi:hypothetical protein